MVLHWSSSHSLIQPPKLDLADVPRHMYLFFLVGVTFHGLKRNKNKYCHSYKQSDFVQPDPEDKSLVNYEVHKSGTVPIRRWKYHSGTNILRSKWVGKRKEKEHQEERVSDSRTTKTEEKTKQNSASQVGGYTYLNSTFYQVLSEWCL